MKTNGLWAEEKAALYLQDLGWNLLLKNFSWKYGEIDLIMEDKDCLIFVEVRSLTDSPHIHPAETINPNKIRKIKKTAEFFIHKNKFYDKACRFDFIAVQGSPDDFELEHLTDVF